MVFCRASRLSGANVAIALLIYGRLVGGMLDTARVNVKGEDDGTTEG
jgi:hypothetical protein